MTKQNTSILYYTNNLLPSDLLESTLKSVNDICSENDCELIITSHFPITKKYEEVSISDNSEDQMYLGQINPQTGVAKLAGVYNYLVKNLCLNINSNHKSYVVGKLPYVHKSIFKQIIFSLQKAEGDNIIFMEHDCFYPSEYVNIVNNALQEHNFGYINKRTCFFDHEGFFKADHRVVLSGCWGKKDILLPIFERKLELLNANKRYYFEPLSNSLSDEFKEQYKEEIFASKPICIDGFLPEHHDMLDIKHGFNQCGQLSMLRTEHNAILEHPYWGKTSKFMKMINIDIDPMTKKLCLLGSSLF
jgi:hypothetical protein